MVRVSRTYFFIYLTMPRRAAEESEPSAAQRINSQKLATENDAPSSERESKTLLMILSSNVLNLGRVTDQQDIRPSQSNRGKGGAIAQLQAVSDCLHTKSTKKNANILQDIQDPINKLAPPAKGRRVASKAAVHPHPAKADPPLKLNAPNPTFMSAKQNPIFGFKSRTLSSDIACDSDVHMEPEVVKHVVKRAEERLAEEVSNPNNNGESLFFNLNSSFQIYVIR
jgi:hypothetical protein